MNLGRLCEQRLAAHSLPLQSLTSSPTSVSSCSLSSSHQGLLKVLPSQLAFTVPCAWNSLPPIPCSGGIFSGRPAWPLYLKLQPSLILHLVSPTALITTSRPEMYFCVYVYTVFFCVSPLKKCHVHEDKAFCCFAHGCIPRAQKNVNKCLVNE